MCMLSLDLCQTLLLTHPCALCLMPSQHAPVDNSAASMSSVACRSFEVSALGDSPNTSGAWLLGRDSM
jgi:hypothetical protein